MAEGSVSACGRGWGWGEVARDLFDQISSEGHSRAFPGSPFLGFPITESASLLPGNCFSLDGNRMLGSLGGRGRRPLRTVMGNGRLPGSHDRTRKATISFSRNLPCGVSRENRAEPLTTPSLRQCA